MPITRRSRKITSVTKKIPAALRSLAKTLEGRKKISPQSGGRASFLGPNFVDHLRRDLTMRY